MAWILPLGTELELAGASAPVRLLGGLGAGSQGQVYEVEIAGERLALKWYLPSCIARDPGLGGRLQQSIRVTSPSDEFLWPIGVLHPTAASLGLIRSRPAGFGSLMPLRPPEFVGAHEHVAGRLGISLSSVLRACCLLADAFHALHLRGLCYRDVSLGNLFLEPLSGRILICDNDNVGIDGRDPGGVLGTPGFMAPEVLLGQTRPSAASDLFSLAVLLFRLLTRSDPLRGRRELAIHCLDEPARRRLYGEDPLFVFDPRDTRNRPDPVDHAAALVTWPIYPRELQALFEQTFGAGLRQPEQRVRTGQWRRTLALCLDRRQLCGRCHQETFPDPAAAAGAVSCWSCGSPLAPPLRLQLPHGLVSAAPDNELHPHHFDPLLPEGVRAPLGRIEAHPQEPDVLGLRNLGGERWIVDLADGRRVPLDPGRTCNLAPAVRIRTPSGPITPRR